VDFEEWKLQELQACCNKWERFLGVGFGCLLLYDNVWGHVWVLGAGHFYCSGQSLYGLRFNSH
jgi:hypothetical protein